jgi:hypothetical protein
VLKAHSHPDDRYVIVLRGTFYHGIAEKFDESKLEARPVGSFLTEPKGVRHFGMTKDEGVVLYFVGTGPSTTDNLEKRNCNTVLRSEVIEQAPFCRLTSAYGRKADTVLG